MRAAVRVVLLVVGLGVALFGASVLTGGWLGRSPWWGPRPSGPEPPTSLVATDVMELRETTSHDDVRRQDTIRATVLLVGGLVIAVATAWPRQDRAPPS